MMREPRPNQHLICIHNTERWIAALLAIMVVIVVLIWGAYVLGERQAGFSQAQMDAEAEALQQQVSTLIQEKEALQRQNAKFLRDHNIDEDANKQINKNLAQAQAQIMDMKEELTFYRNIVSPKKLSRTVVVKKVSMLPLKENEYQYKIVLIQDGKHDRVVRGVVEISLEGNNSEGKLVRLSLPTISTVKVKKQQKFGFKYFQNFEGSIKIPAGFSPSSLYIRVLPRSSSRVPKVERVLVWDELIAVGGQQNVGQTEN